MVSIKNLNDDCVGDFELPDLSLAPSEVPPGGGSRGLKMVFKT